MCVVLPAVINYPTADLANVGHECMAAYWERASNASFDGSAGGWRTTGCLLQRLSDRLR